LKLYALSALDEMAKNNEDLAIKIVDIPTLPHVIIFLTPNFVDKKVQVYFPVLFHILFFLNYNYHD